MSDTPNPKQFEVVRLKQENEEAVYFADGRTCPACGMPTMTGEDPSRRYCSHRLCSALIVG